MLALTRRVDEDILIGDDIVVRVASIYGDKVRLAISAPDDVAIDRREIRESKDKAKQQ
jgi:carbon storage regulator